MAHTDLDVGPIDYLAVGLPGATLTGEALAEPVTLADLDGEGELDLGAFSGIESELLDDDDIAQG